MIDNFLAWTYSGMNGRYTDANKSVAQLTTLIVNIFIGFLKVHCIFIYIKYMNCMYIYFVYLYLHLVLLL